MTRRSQLVVALDVPTREDALRLRDSVAEFVDLFKVGKELFTSVGPSILDDLDPARVFLDLKFHDIPNTVAGAVRAAGRLGVRIVDVHASGGSRMMEAARDAAHSVASPPEVFAVTVLTHLADEELGAVGVSGRAMQQVVRLARLAAASGLDGVVASAREVEAVLEATEGKLDLLVPGVRPAWSDAGQDQRRVASPGEAARAGARYVVVGRAITQAGDPGEAAKRVAEELASA